MSAFNMDIIESFNQAVKDMQWEELVSTVRLALDDVLAEEPYTSLPTFTPPAPAPVHAGFEQYTNDKPGEMKDREFGDFEPAEAVTLFDLDSSRSISAPALVYETLRHEDIMEQSHYQANANQEQLLSHQWTADNAATVYPAASQPVSAAAPQQFVNGLKIIPEDLMKQLQPVGEYNGTVIYDYPTVASPLNTTVSKKRKRESDGDGPYIKKPLNAFMLFLKTQQLLVADDIAKGGRSAVTKHLGAVWKSMTNEEKAKYYTQADEERRLHALKYPEWSNLDSYGKKRKRVRRRGTSTAKDVPAHTGATDIPQSDVMEGSTQVQLPHRPSPLPYPGCQMQQMYNNIPGPPLSGVATTSWAVRPAHGQPF
ncbi:lymphoid enhancer-binding factor 1-like isoform X2 [Notolabrus celidotus]|uniref:lymphoid enhancer-binding factor 1-like isoform X2 n=1 Tax=Notolabrus celidotus TaxID=1203425 RepID=UPI00148F6D45|nr:lymphoid enhancer-binding factor 1-like isoform X2 [Notolabrus celidotus]